MKAVVIPLLLFMVLTSSCAVVAHNNVIVIPLSGDDAKPLKNIVSVAKKNGDFDDLREAIYSIKDAGPDNPYLIVIAPGIYDIPNGVQMKDFVSIAGSGRGVTTLAWSRRFFPNPPFGEVIFPSVRQFPSIRGSNNATVSDLSIDHQGGNEDGDHTAIISGEVGFRVERVSIDMTSRQAHQCFGISNTDASPIINDVTIYHNSCGATYGVYNAGNSKPTLSNMRITAINVFSGYRSVQNRDTSIATIDNVFASVVGTLGDSCILENRDSASMIVTNSHIGKSSIAVCLGNSVDTRITNTVIDSGVLNDAEGVQCRNTYDADLNDVSC